MGWGKVKKALYTCMPCMTAWRDVPLPEEVQRVLEQFHQTIDLLEHKISHLEHQMQGCHQNARRYANSGQRKRALAQLKRHKALDQSHTRFLAIQTNVQIMADQVSHVTVQHEVAQCFETHQHRIGNLMQQFDIGKIDDMVVSMQQFIDQQADVDAALSDALPDGGIDEQDLEGELAALMATEQHRDTVDVGSLSKMRKLHLPHFSIMSAARRQQPEDSSTAGERASSPLLPDTPDADGDSSDDLEFQQLAKSMRSVAPPSVDDGNADRQQHHVVESQRTDMEPDRPTPRVNSVIRGRPASRTLEAAHA
jgi:hypothetical protein